VAVQPANQTNNVFEYWWYVSVVYRVEITFGSAGFFATGVLVLVVVVVVVGLGTGLTIELVVVAALLTGVGATIQLKCMSDRTGIYI
jgi:hypothetical protein